MPAAAFQRWVISSHHTRAGAALWLVLYRGVMRFVAALLSAGLRASVYVKREPVQGSLVAGLSDIDLVVIAAAHPERARRRWKLLARLVPPLRAVVDEPRIHSSGEAAETWGVTAIDRSGPARYAGRLAGTDAVRAFERPGLHSAGAKWTLLRGEDVLPAKPVRASEPAAAWLELVWCWRLALIACRLRDGPRARDLCWKMLADAAATVMFLDGGWRPAERSETLRTAVDRIPSAASTLELAMELSRHTGARDPAPLAVAVNGLASLSRRAAALIWDRAGGEMARVTLAGATDRRATAPLCDWRGIVAPREPFEGTEIRRDGVHIDSIAPRREGSPVLVTDGELAVVPAVGWSLSRLRALLIPAAAPAMFAVIRGEQTAAFPELPGFSAADVAERAVIEARARLLSRPAAGDHDPNLVLAARAGLFARSVAAGEPRLPITEGATLSELGVAKAEPGLRRLVDSLLDQTPASARH